MAELFGSATLKLQRAREHIEELRAATEPLDKRFYEVRAATRFRSRDQREETYQLLYRPRRAIAETLALGIGDASHNLRSALDHLAHGIITRWHPQAATLGSGISFPSDRRREALEASQHLTRLEEALPGARALLLDRIRPKGGPGERLWSFSALAGSDRMKLLLPEVTLVAVNGLFARAGGVVTRDCAVGGPADAEHKLLGAEAPIAFKNGFEAQVTLTFSKGLPYEGQPVVATLAQCAEAVEQTIEAFAALAATRQAA